ncbi:MAG: hypothetical protein B0D91_05395 [Oceanospirillales bacterium LUC14_002_19_P2]|nr:MAG: hypothetical protein B0D91_05395 [Oceanospirillales bacterium LUC14_002_19_P2]
MHTCEFAVIGAGVSGLVTAWLLSRHHDVALIEQNQWFGGHTHTVPVDDPVGLMGIDTGFIVFNRKNYPHLSSFFDHLKVDCQAVPMTFSASIGQGDIEYAGDNLDTLFAQRSKLFSPSHWRMIADILKFNARAREDLSSGIDPDLSLRDYLNQLRLGDGVRDHYLLPMAAAIWSCPLATMLEFPAASFLRFFANHGLLSVSDRPQWYSVKGGSQAYVQAVLAQLTGPRFSDSPVERVEHDGQVYRIHTASGNQILAENVVFGCHADEALALLGERATEDEQALLSCFRYQENTAWLHTDERLMPERRKVWSSWNYLADYRLAGRPVSVTYWMNILQKLPEGARNYLVSLNPLSEPAQDKVIKRITWNHPVFDREAMRAQASLKDLQGKNNRWFCGSYFGYGFHEDGIRSAVELCNAMGIKAPWQEVI